MKIAIKSAIGTILLLILVFPHHEVQSSSSSVVVSEWATKFGEELRRLAEVMTKSSELKNSYSKKARIFKKNGTRLMDDIVKNIGRMLNRKMDAANRIANKSSEEAYRFHQEYMADPYYYFDRTNMSYYSSKFSRVNGTDLRDISKDMKSVRNSTESNIYRNMTMDRDSHFFDLNVNTSHSSVHVPTNVYDRSNESREFIEWSEALDEVFIQNYRTDPALSWQYFGSSLGIMRHYPALAWNRNKTDTYDCRKKSWYIETATCSKDVVILYDNSGSMTGYRNYVAKLTLEYLLDTLSNNDFVSVIKYNDIVRATIDCFNETLVQATKENIKAFNDEAKEEPTEDRDLRKYANVTEALKKAFQILEKYRDLRNCSGSESGCNQAIMLITDGVEKNATDIFEEYNYLNSNTTSPVRVFSYLLGKEVTKVKEFQAYACLNRGYYSHIQSLDEVAEEVLHYVNVIAAPLVLQKEEKPPTWTHTYVDKTSSFDELKSKDEKTDFRLIISVGVPAFNLSSYGDGNSTGRPSLLGVAGTDIPVDDIKKLALPHKLGVNGYSFIVSNNGYVLLHPDLRPYDTTLDQELVNYNSIDFTEIEFVDYEEYNTTNKNMTTQRTAQNFNENDKILKHPRIPSSVMEELRNNLVDGKKGEMLNVSVLFDYDNLKRIEKSRQDYYYAPIPYTPFSLGIALPHDYGNTEINVGEIIHHHKLRNMNISKYFEGQNWKIHPDWVYCKYHYLEGHEFNKTELELLEFLRKIQKPGWKWYEQYEADDDDSENSDEMRTSLNEESYYCNKDLVELLVFDAQVTNESFQEWSFKSDEDKELVDSYEAKVRFIGTMSGLTRWQFIYGELTEVDGDTEFGDSHNSSIEEPWYQNAIFQHHIEKDSFVYSVEHFNVNNSEPSGEEEVYGSMAIFPRDGGLEAPSGVVGFSFSRKLMHERFKEITSKVNVNCDNCIKGCGAGVDEQFCYVIDNNGYIILSEGNNSGRFFGEVERAAMEVLVNENIFKKLVFYDLQGMCNIPRLKFKKALASSLITPFKLMFLAFKWMIAEVFIELSRIKYYMMINAFPDESLSYEEADHEEDTKITTTSTTSKPKIKKKPSKGLSSEDEEWYKNQEIREATEMENNYVVCDKKSELYVMQQNGIIKDRTFILDEVTNGSSPFYAHKIPKSNLLLIVITKLGYTPPPVDEYKTLNTNQKSMNFIEEYGCDLPCHKLYLNDLHRRRLTECFTEHEKEEETSYCGAGAASRLTQSILLMLLPMTVSTVYIVKLFL